MVGKDDKGVFNPGKFDAVDWAVSSAKVTAGTGVSAAFHDPEGLINLMGRQEKSSIL